MNIPKTGGNVRHCRFDAGPILHVHEYRLRADALNSKFVGKSLALVNSATGKTHCRAGLPQHARKLPPQSAEGACH
jgi:hypothetical protein